MATVAAKRSIITPRTNHAGFCVDFKTDCNLDGWIGYLLTPESREQVSRMEQLYIQNHFASERVIGAVKPVGIPRILHQIWFGPAIPRKYLIQIQMWRSHHPGWEYRLWTEADLDEFDSDIVKLIRQADCFGQKGDILRMAVLQKYGGLYADVDYDCYRSCEILNDSFDFYTTMRGFPVLHMQFPDAFPSPIAVCNSLVGSIANHPIQNAFLERIGERIKQHELTERPSRLPFWGRVNRMRKTVKTSYQLYQEVFAEFAGESRYVDIALPPTFFNPIDTNWPSRFVRPAFYAHLPGFLLNRDFPVRQYNLTQVRPHSFGHHESHASWL